MSENKKKGKEENTKQKAKRKRKAPVDTQIIKKEDILPSQMAIIPLDGKPVVPGMLLPVFVRGDKNIRALMEHLEKMQNSFVGFVYTKKELHQSQFVKEEADDVSSPSPVDAPGGIANIGIAAQIVKMMQLPTGDYQILIRGLKRFKIDLLLQEEPFYMALVTYPPMEWMGEEQEIRAYALSIATNLKEISQASPIFPEELKFILSNLSLSEPDRLCDFALLITNATAQEVQEILESFSLMERLQKTLLLLKKELDFLRLKEKINKQIEEKISQRQREFFLREQLKAIKKELGFEQDEKTAEMARLQKLISEKELNEEAKAKFDEEVKKLALLEVHSPEFGVTRNYLDWLVSLPWGKKSVDNLDLESARKILDEDHYGLEDVKDRLIEFLAVGKLLQQVEGSILCFVGPPGVGKTSLGKSIARALGRKFFRFSVGGMSDEAEIKGHRRTYIGSLPGKLIQAIKTVGTDNPVIMLDEVDKIGKDYRGDPSSALLEVLDPEQNNTFRDHYLEAPYNLSHILFIATANILDTIPLALRDRMEVIHLAGYIKQEKVEILTRHIIPKQRKRHGLSDDQIQFSKAALEHIIELYAREAGVRGAEKQLNKIMRKTAVRILQKNKKKIRVGVHNIEKFLGPAIYRESPLDRNFLAGVSTGLAWTSLGGSVLFVEAVSKVAKPFGFKQTGQLGEVMVESSQIAYSYVVANTKAFQIPEDYFSKRQIHLHVPEGATPKDGPSAGITMATSLISLALDKRMDNTIAMTGELTLTGRVLPVGGIREKLIAAKRAKVKTVILPEQNRRDIQEIPKYITEGLTIHFVEYYPQVYEMCFPKK